MDNNTELKKYLRGLASLCKNNHSARNPYHWLLNCGVVFDFHPKPDDIGWGKKKECYSNAARLALNSYTHKRELIYCEGYAVPNLIAVPMSHAWVYDLQNNTLIDPTWRDGGCAYFGIPFTREFLSKTLLKTKRYGDIIYAAFEQETRDFLQPILTIPANPATGSNKLSTENKRPQL